jgi:hypothetical protein
MITLRYGGVKHGSGNKFRSGTGFSAEPKQKTSGAEKPHPMRAGKHLLIEGLPVF